MFQTIAHTKYPPGSKPLMIFDGQCGFCKYWIVKWKNITKDRVVYQPYQSVHRDFKDIPEQYFKEAVRLITPEGQVYSGPDAAYFTYYMQHRYRFLHKWYHRYNWFQNLSNWGYQWIADHRSLMYRFSIFLFGKNPEQSKAYWLLYLLLLLLIVLGCFY